MSLAYLLCETLLVLREDAALVAARIGLCHLGTQLSSIERWPVYTVKPVYSGHPMWPNEVTALERWPVYTETRKPSTVVTLSEGDREVTSIIQLEKKAHACCDRLCPLIYECTTTAWLRVKKRRGKWKRGGGKVATHTGNWIVVGFTTDCMTE